MRKHGLEHLLPTKVGVDGGPSGSDAPSLPHDKKQPGDPGAG
jgi:hypothetical protein